MPTWRQGGERGEGGVIVKELREEREGGAWGKEETLEWIQGK
jgi:hypothetical protein